MNNKEYAGIVLQELTHTLSSIDEVQAEKFVQLIDEADEVFCAGAGRSGFQVKGFAMRLMHMGVASYVVGETCTPNIKEGGVLVVCSGSGETKSLVNHAAKAKEMGARVALITINPNSSIAMGSLFEQSEGIFMDIAVMMLMERRGKDSDTMFGRHANME